MPFMQGVGEQPSDIRQLLSVRWEQVATELELELVSVEEELSSTLADELPFWLVAELPLLSDEFPFVSELVTGSLESPSRSSLDGLLELSSQAVSEMASTAAMVAMDPVTLRLQDDVQLTLHTL